MQEIRLFLLCSCRKEKRIKAVNYVFISIISTIILLIKDYKHTKQLNLSTLIMLVGVMIAAVPAVFKLLCLYLRVLFPQSVLLENLFRIDSYTYGLMLILIAMLVSMVFLLVESIRYDAVEEQLKELAYMDMLTGIHNRNYCVEQLTAYDKDPQKEYGIVFFDADGLKHANDVYGHRIGDELIRTTAECISHAFGSLKGFYGRWGGDEFIAVIENVTEIPSFEERFEKEVAHINERKKFPFPYRVSYGAAEKNYEHAATTTEVCNLADEKMYLYKKAHKQTTPVKETDS